MKSTDHTESLDQVELTPTLVGVSDIRVYEYGVRLTPESAQAADQQIFLSRRLYNDIIAVMRRVYDEMQAWVLARAGDEAAALNRQVEALTEQFMTAKAANDEATLKDIAAQRRVVWKQLATALAKTRKEHAQSLRDLFYSRIGNKSETETYQLRSQAVNSAPGLGFATATFVLNRALVAWKMSMKQGRPPRFARGDEILQDTLQLQFTQAGGVPSTRILKGEHKELQLVLPPELMKDAPKGPRRSEKRGEFAFRLGAAKSQSYATGTWQYHRPLPPGKDGAGVAVKLANLVRRRAANKFKWYLQLTIQEPDREPIPTRPKGTLATVHTGWAQSDTGREIAGIADAADPGLAQMVFLPEDLERDLARAQEIQSQRDQNRDVAVDALKQIDPATISGLSEKDVEFFAKLKQTRPNHVAARKFYVAQAILRAVNAAPAWLSEWVANDRTLWQASVGIARRARARRRHFYRKVANHLADTYSAIVLEVPDLAKAALKLDTVTGEKTEFTAAARRGRQTAALYEFESMVKAACENRGTALFELSGAPTVSTCPLCGGDHVHALTNVDGSMSSRQVQCDDCGAQGERKLFGAARAWQLTQPGIEDRIVDYHASVKTEKAAAKQKKDDQNKLKSEGRRNARVRRKEEGNDPDNIRPGTV